MNVREPVADWPKEALLLRLKKLPLYQASGDSSRSLLESRKV
jgi:hypothetical protein